VIWGRASGAIDLKITSRRSPPERVCSLVTPHVSHTARPAANAQTPGIDLASQKIPSAEARRLSIRSRILFSGFAGSFARRRPPNGPS